MLTRTQAVGRMPVLHRVGRRMNASMRACAAWATLEEHDKILDMACGDGTLLFRLSERYRLTVCGLCETPEQARAVRDRLGGADVMYARMEDIPWRDATFDVALLPAPLRGDARRILMETLRVLRAGGQLVMAVPLFSVLGEGELGRRELMRLMQEAGFHEVSFRFSGLAGAIVGWKQGKTPCESL